MSNARQVTKEGGKWFSVVIFTITVFILGSIVYDVIVTKPKIQDSLNQIEVKVDGISTQLDGLAVQPPFQPTTRLVIPALNDSLETIEK